MAGRKAGSFYRLRGKRLLDLAITIPALLIISPIALFISVLIRLKMGRPVLFMQERPGLGGEHFNLIKFRTMTEERCIDGQLLPDSQRLTPLGRKLRSLSMDETPELINVLKGEMSLVGPRPLLMEYLPLYSEEQMRRHEVRPGITGWTQVNGRNAISWDEKFKLDIWYIDNQSFAIDLRILILTIKRVIARDGINAVGDATMPKFQGSGKS